MQEDSFFSNLGRMYIIRFLSQFFLAGAIIVPFFLDWAKIDYTRIFFLEAFFTFCVFALEIPTGLIADKFGRKTSIALSGIVMPVAFLIFGLINDYRAFFVAEFFAALGVSLLSGADKALIYDSLKKERKEARKYFSRYDMAGTVGIVVAMPIGSLIAGSSLLPYPASLPFTVILSGAIFSLSFFVALTLKEPKRKEKVKEFVEEGIEGFRYIFSHKKLRLFALNFAFISATTFFMFWFYQSLSGVMGFDIKYNGFIGAGFNIFSILLLWRIKDIEKTFGIEKMIFYSALIPGIFYSGLFFFKNVPFVLVAIFMITGLKIMRGPILYDFMNRHIQSRNRATVLSGVSMLEKIIITVIYPIIGLLADFSLYYTFLFLGIATIIFAFINKVEAEHLD